MNTLQEFRDFYAAIPEEKWCTCQATDSEGNHCAVGHLPHEQWQEYIGEETMKLRALTDPYIFKRLGMKDSRAKDIVPAISYVNDGASFVQGNSPKERVLNCLDEIIAEEELQNTVQNIANQPIKQVYELQGSF